MQERFDPPRGERTFFGPELYIQLIARKKKNAILYLVQQRDDADADSLANRVAIDSDGQRYPSPL